MIQEKSETIIVVGVGGGGENAVDYICRQGIENANFMVCNTDLEKLENSAVPIKIQLGNLNSGAAGNPETGRKAALNSADEIRAALAADAKIVVIIAGMGGGTGTGAAPVIASIAKETGKLTVVIVFTPFQFEGQKRINQAKEGLKELNNRTDLLLILDNEKLIETCGDMLIREVFSKVNLQLTKTVEYIAYIARQGTEIFNLKKLCASNFLRYYDEETDR